MTRIRVMLMFGCCALLSTPFGASGKRGDLKPPVAADKVLVGPDVGKGKPVVVDTIGGAQTTFRALGGPGSKSKPSRWRMELKVVVFDADQEDQDVMLAQLYRGRRKLGAPTVCVRSITLGHGSRKEYQLGYKLFAFLCEEKFRVARDYAKMHDTKGAHSIKLSMKRVLKDTVVKDFATLKVNVVQLGKGAANRPTRAWGTDHDEKMPVSLIYEHPIGFRLGSRRMRGEWERGAYAVYGAGGQYATHLVIMTWYKYDKDRPSKTSMTCFHDGKKIGWKPIDSLWGYKFEQWTHKRKKQIHSKWHQVRYDLGRGGVKFRKMEGRTPNYAKPPFWIADNPGKYRCVAIRGGNIVKEFHFTVAGGKIEAPGCQAASINTLHNVILVPTKTKKTGDARWNKKAGKKVGFEGRARWGKGCPPVVK